MPKKGFHSKCIHYKQFKEAEGLNLPIYTSTAYKLELEDDTEVIYPRYLNNPNQVALAEKIADLENGNYGFTIASGMAAISTALLSVLKSGDHAIIQRQIYGGSYSFVEHELRNRNIDFTWLEATHIKNLETHIKNNTKVVYVETPSNPLLEVIDLSLVASLAKKHKLVSITDNTFATPYNQRPLDLGIDIVAHSGTKYLGGHSDLICGALITNEESLAKAIAQFIKHYGQIMNAFEHYLLDRSLKTLGIRMAKHNANALEVAKFLEKHPRIRKVYYPGLESFSGYQVAAKQMSGFGGMLSFELDGKLDDVKTFINKLDMVVNAVSLGGVESTLCLPRLTSHAHMTAQQREEAGISDTLVRLSVGIEDLEDLIGDFKQAL